jgi:hypothetical protein
MRTVQGNMLITLRGVQSFLNDHAARLPDVLKSGARQDLDDAIVELSTHLSDHAGNSLSAQGATQRHQLLRTALLHDHMAPIARIARAKLPQTPELAPLRMPSGRPTLARLVGAARGMADAAAPFGTVFTAAGLPADFIAQLEAATTAMLESANDRLQHRGKVKGATDGFDTTLTTARHTVSVLDAFVRTTLKDDPTLLGHWRRVKRVTSARRSTPVTPLPVPGAPGSAATALVPASTASSVVAA